MAVLRVHNLSYSVNQIQILQSVSFEMGPRDCLVLIGPNGGGKTTLLKLLMGMISPTSGHIDLLDGHPAQTRHRVGYLPQRPTHSLDYPIIVSDFIKLGQLASPWWGYRLSHHPSQADLEDLFGIQSLSKRPLSQLSGGELQRVLLVRLMLNRPEILILDEPASAMDPSGEETLLATMAGLLESIPMILVTHDLTALPKVATHIGCLNRSMTLHGIADITPESIQNLYDFPMHLNLHRHDH